MRRVKDLRIPVTEAEKELVAEAMLAAGMEMAGWARAVLLREAQTIVDAAQAARGKKKK